MKTRSVCIPGRRRASLRHAGLCLVLALLAAPAAKAAARLQLSIQTQNTPKPGSRNVPAGDTRQLEATLAGSYIAASSAQHTTVYDFQRRRRLVLDDARRSYVDHSLYDVAGGRGAELLNRKHLAGAMGAAGLQDAMPGALADAHVLAVTQATLPSPVESADGTGWNDGAGQPMARRGTVLLEAGADDVRAYAQLLRYTVGGHPQILAALAAGKGIPQQVVFSFRHPWGESTRTVTVKTVQTLPRQPTYDLSGWQQRSTPDASRMDELLDRAAVLDADAVGAARKRTQAQADDAWRAGRVFEAYLGTLEFHLMSGLPMERFAPQQLEQLRADAAVQRLNRIMAARSKEQVAQAVGQFAGLQQAAGPKAHVLKIFEANNRAQLGEPDAAMRLFAEVLQANPALAGAYKDLGDVFFMRYDAARAWRCWDAGRRIAPDFPNFRKVTEFERRLAADFPEYF